MGGLNVQLAFYRVMSPEMRDVTFGITSFERPRLLENLVRSILQRYPLAKIIVADNGKKSAVLPDSVTHLKLPFDCGLSRARNALVDAMETNYLLVLEDDFLFTDETTVESLLEILEADDEVGCVGGAMRSLHGRISAYALDIEVFRQTMYVREATHRVQFTPSGLPYRLCDMIWNFALYRKEMLVDHRWIDRLKVGEHCPFFHQVKLAGRWRVAVCNETRIDHVAEKRSANYLQFRQRAQDMFESYLAEYGIKNYNRVLPFHFEDDENDKPSVIVLGVGHSGTSILSKMLGRLGWNTCDADKQFGESVSVRRINMALESTGHFQQDKALRILEKMPRPWVLKDPRFVNTLHNWMPLFQLMEQKPTLVRIRRNQSDLLNSYRRREAPGDYTQRVLRNLDACKRQYERWPWGRFSIDYEFISNAVALFDPTRGRSGSDLDAGSMNLVKSSATPSQATGIETDSQPMMPELNATLQSLGIQADSSVGSALHKISQIAAAQSLDSSYASENTRSTLTRGDIGLDSSVGLNQLLSSLSNAVSITDSSVDDSPEMLPRQANIARRQQTDGSS